MADLFAENDKILPVSYADAMTLLVYDNGWERWYRNVGNAPVLRQT